MTFRRITHGGGMTVHERKVLLAFKAEAITKAVTDWMLGRDNLDKRLTEEDRSVALGQDLSWNIPNFSAFSGSAAAAKATLLGLPSARMTMEYSVLSTPAANVCECSSPMAARAKEEQMKKNCGNKAYKGIRKPVCNNGNPCEACREKYADMHPGWECSGCGGGIETKQGICLKCLGAEE